MFDFLICFLNLKTIFLNNVEFFFWRRNEKKNSLRDMFFKTARHVTWKLKTCIPSFMLLTFIADPAFQHVLEYFTERTPRSHFDYEERETSLVWNYKYAGAWIILTENLFLYFFPAFFPVTDLIISTRCWVWKTSSKGHAAASLDRSDF